MANFVFDPDTESTGALSNPPWNNILGAVWSNVSGTPNSLQSTGGGANITVIDDGLGEDSGEYNEEQWVGGRLGTETAFVLHGCTDGAGDEYAVLLDRSTSNEIRIFTFTNSGGVTYTQRATTSGASISDSTDLLLAYQSGTYTAYYGIDHPDDIGSETGSITYSDTAYATRSATTPPEPAPGFHEFSSTNNVFYIQGGDVFSAADTTAPTFTAGPAVSSLTSSGGTATGTIDETGDIYYVVVADGATAPTSTEVLAGTGSGGSGELASGSATATTSISDAFSGLSSSTAYDLYMVARDDEGTPNVQTSPTLVNFTTSAPAGATISAVNDDDVVHISDADQDITVDDSTGITSVTVNGVGTTNETIINGTAVEYDVPNTVGAALGSSVGVVANNGADSNSFSATLDAPAGWSYVTIDTADHPDAFIDDLAVGDQVAYEEVSGLSISTAGIISFSGSMSEFDFIALDASASYAATAGTWTIPDTTAPKITSASINSAGTEITFAGDENLNIGVGGNSGFSLSMSGGSVVATYSSGDGSSSLVYSLSRPVLSGETGTHDYTQPGNGVEDDSGNDLASYSGASVTNNSAEVAPTLSSSTVNAAGTQITLSFTESVSVGSGGNSGFTISLSGGAATLSYVSGSGSSSLVYSVSRTVYKNETGTIDYTQPGDGIEDSAGVDLASFSGGVVTNSSTQNQAPAWSAIPNRSFSVNAAVSWDISSYASDPDGDDLSAGFSEVTLPSWASISSAGVITGTAPATSQAAVTSQVSVTDGTGNTNSSTFDITVTDILGDTYYDVLQNLGYTGSLSDMQFEYLMDQGHVGGMSDMVKQHLESLGYSGSVTDMVRQKADAEGYTDVSDMLKKVGMVSVA